jgi:tryptophanyl-tRNA synthetase
MRLKILYSLISKQNQQYYSQYQQYRYLSNSINLNQQKIVFSGIQPTSIPHIGNYFGAIRQWIDLQEIKTNKMIISIVDLHAITLPKNPKILRDYIIKSAAILLSCGIEPKQTILYQQSSVPYHGQLSWLFSCLSNMSQLTHMHQFKSKSNNLNEIPVGLFGYPVLQTADILLYRYIN